MAISFEMSNYRSDFMLSDAAMPRRVEAQINKEQTNGFAQMLKDLGSATPEVKAEIVPDKPIAVTPGTAVIEQIQDPEGNSALPDDPFELARMILRGKVDIDEIPKDKLTPELLKALIIVAKTEDLNETDEEGKDEEEDFFVQNGEEASKSIEALTLLDQLLAVLYRFIAAYNEKHEGSGDKVIGGIEELLSEFPEISELYGVLSESANNSGDDTLKAHIAKMLAEQTAENRNSEEQPANVDSFVKSDELPAETRTVETAQVTFAEEVSKAIGEENVRLLEEAAQNGELGEVKVEVKTVTKTEVKQTVPEEQPVEDVPEQPVKTDAAADRAKAISEELEMLRNARLNKNTAQPVVAEKTAEEKESAPIPAASSLEVDSPIVFTRRDGSEITVRPSDVVAQTAKLVETMIAENKEQTEYSLVLNPEDLGRITVKLVKAADGAISVTIAAENARTQRILDQNSQLMQSNLRDDGIRLENWQVVRESQQETLAQDYNGSSKNPYYREDNAQEDEDEDQKSFAEIIAAM